MFVLVDFFTNDPIFRIVCFSASRRSYGVAKLSTYLNYPVTVISRLTGSRNRELSMMMVWLHGPVSCNLSRYEARRAVHGFLRILQENSMEIMHSLNVPHTV